MANSNSLPAILKFTAANSNSPRQVQIHHSKFKIHRGKCKFTTANSKSLRQIKIRHGKLKFTKTTSKCLLTVRFATAVGLVLRGFGLVLVVRVCFCGELRGLLGFGGGWFGAFTASCGHGWSLDFGAVVRWLWPLVGVKTLYGHAL